MIEFGGIIWLFNSEFYLFYGVVKVIKEVVDLVGMDKLMWGLDYFWIIMVIIYKMFYDFIFKMIEMI